MPHALLLSPDDQAVSAITGVLEEMSVTCERPMDGVSAAHKLNSQTFDLVLVDCENLPAAKLIFDVCRRGKNGNNPVPIAIVDGRAGLPTAFRLGAELILTKPVAKDQARSTIRTAVGRVRKDVQPSDNVLAQPADAQPVDATTPETHARAAAASASPQLTSFADPVGSSGAGAALALMTATSDISSDVTIPIATDFASTATSDVLTDTMNLAPLGALTDRFSTTLAASVAPATQQAYSGVEEIDVAQHSPTFNSDSTSLQALSVPASPSEPSADQASPLTWKSAREVKPSDDPVLAELERTELEASELAEAKSKNPASDISASDNPAPAQPALESTPLFPSSRRNQQKNRGPLVALLMFGLVCAGFYVAWMYEPGFRAIVQPQIDRVMAIAGVAPQPQTMPLTTSNTNSMPTPSTPTPALATDSAPDPNQAQANSSDSATPPVATTLSAAPATVPPAVAPSPATTAPASASLNATAATPVVGKPESVKPSDSKKDAPVASSAGPLPGEDTAIILSSKGAEKRLDHSVPPKFPADTSAGQGQGQRQAQGTVVLKAVVDESGKVEGLRLVEGNPILAAAAIEAVKQWHYRPYLRDEKPQPFQTVVIVDFNGNK
jgi:periplasmic protein TonB